MSELLVLDPGEVSYNRTELDLTRFVADQGPDFGDAAIELFLAEGYRGQIPVDFKVPNRVITIPLLLHDTDGRSFDDMRQFVQAKAALIQREGGWLKRQVGDNPVYADLVGATLHLGGSTAQAMWDVDADAVLTLEAIPDFYGDEISLGDHSESTLPELVFTESGIKGDFPARCRLVVDEDQGVNQLGVVFGFRSRHYNAAATARLAYRASQMTRLDSAVLSGTSVVHGTIGRSWTPILSTDLLAGGSLTHTGTYRVFARVLPTGAGGAEQQIRLVWDVGDMTSPSENRPWSFPSPPVGAWFNVDLGEVRIDAARAGVHKWMGHIQGKALTDGAAGISINDVWLVPVDDGFGRLAAAPGDATSLTGYSVRDDFDQPAGALAGKTVGSGGLWTTAGPGADFQVNTTFHCASRTAVSDPGFADGRYAVAGTSLANSMVYVGIFHSAAPANSGVLLRYTDTTHWLMGRVSTFSFAFGSGVVQSKTFSVLKCNGGTPVTLASVNRPDGLGDAVWGLALHADTAGRFRLWAHTSGTEMQVVADGADSDLATGGALASGRQGFHDSNTSSVAVTRNYDYFAGWVPTPDAVLFANQSAELATGGHVRETAAGGSYGPVSTVVGDLPRLPPSGLEGRPVEVFVKASRGDFGAQSDSFLGSVVADNISAQLFYRPSWLFTPEVTDIGIGGLFPAIDLFPAPDLYPEF